MARRSISPDNKAVDPEPPFGPSALDSNDAQRNKPCPGTPFRKDCNQKDDTSHGPFCFAATPVGAGIADPRRDNIKSRRRRLARGRPIHKTISVFHPPSVLFEMLAKAGFFAAVVVSGAAQRYSIQC